jgi:type 1 glutamine amidotransferase
VENSPLVYLQNGHDNTAWTNPAFQTLMLNAIKWTASQEGRAWARKNPKVIFSNA